MQQLTVLLHRAVVCTTGQQHQARVQLRLTTMLLLIPQGGKAMAALQQVLQETQTKHSPAQQQDMQMLLPLLLVQRATQLLQAMANQPPPLQHSKQQRQVLLLDQGQQRGLAQEQSSRTNQVHRLVLLGRCEWKQTNRRKL